MQRRRFVMATGALLTAPLACASRDDGGLRARAARDGTVRLIVTLAIPGARPATEEAIREAQERLIDTLRGTRYSGVRRFASQPQLALTAGPDALEILLSSPLVDKVAADSLARPMAPGSR